MSENIGMQLSKSQKRFIQKWGEMGTRWGIARSTAMLHGLLYVSAEELKPEEICNLLHIARSNVSMALRELEDYRLIYRHSRPGDRCTYYSAETDVWEIARRILEERRRRETSGAVYAVAECLKSAREEGDELMIQRMEAMQELLEAADAFALVANQYHTSVFKRAIMMGSKLLKWIAK